MPAPNFLVYTSNYLCGGLLREWVKTFPDEFYSELFRLRKVTPPEVFSKRLAYLGKLTNDIIYERLAPGILDELRPVTPKLESGRRKHHFHRRLTDDIGHPKLREHIMKVLTLMNASPNWDVFHRLLTRALPKYTDQMVLVPYSGAEDASLEKDLSAGEDD